MHYAPLEYWKGDRVVYKKGEHLAEVEEVVRVVKDEPIPFAQRRKPARRQNQTNNGRGSTDLEDIDDGTGVDQATIVEGMVAKFPKELYIDGDEEDAEDRRSKFTLISQKMGRRLMLITSSVIAMPHHRLAPRLDRPEFEYQKVFGESAFAAGGIIRIPIGQTKPAKSSKDNAFVSDPGLVLALYWRTERPRNGRKLIFCSSSLFTKADSTSTSTGPVSTLDQVACSWCPEVRQNESYSGEWD